MAGLKLGVVPSALRVFVRWFPSPWLVLSIGRKLWCCPAEHMGYALD